MSRRDLVPVDLDSASRQALEFDDLLGWVASFARTELGARRVRALQPVADEMTILGQENTESHHAIIFSQPATHGEVLTEALYGALKDAGYEYLVIDDGWPVGLRPVE